MILRGGRVALDAEASARIDIGIEGGRIRLPAGASHGPEIDCPGLLILPGLINAHDHLEFNLFPRLGAGPYANATEWARAIYRPSEPPVREQLAVPETVRLLWGAVKNLACGVTTVMHHNPYSPAFDADFPVRVVKRFGWAHSTIFSPDFAARYRDTPPGAPFAIHACEGTDACAAAEARLLEAGGALGANTVLVHAVGLDAPGLDAVRRRGASIVWCPTSNCFTLGRSLSGEALASGVPIALGTDSALTAAGDMTDETAAASDVVGRKRVYRMVTDEAARILRLCEGQGEIRDGGLADLVLVRDAGKTPAEALDGIQPELVLVGGKLKLASTGRSEIALMNRAERLAIDGRGAWFVDCDIPGLLASTTPALGPNFQLAGRRVAS